LEKELYALQSWMQANPPGAPGSETPPADDKKDDDVIDAEFKQS
jgi:hypothetical protein